MVSNIQFWHSNTGLQLTYKCLPHANLWSSYSSVWLPYGCYILHTNVFTPDSNTCCPCAHGVFTTSRCVDAKHSGPRLPGRRRLWLTLPNNRLLMATSHVTRAAGHMILVSVLPQLRFLSFAFVKLSYGFLVFFVWFECLLLCFWIKIFISSCRLQVLLRRDLISLEFPGSAISFLFLFHFAPCLLEVESLSQ